MSNTKAYLDSWKPKAAAVPEDRPTQRRTLRAKPTHINTVTCYRCLGAKVVNSFQWFGTQMCPECEGSGESDE